MKLPKEVEVRETGIGIEGKIDHMKIEGEFLTET